MAKKVLKLGGNNVINTLSVDIGGKKYNVPLAGSMKRKEIIALKDEDTIFEMFARHIPEEVLNDLTVDEYNQLANAWAEANDDKDDAKLGE